MSINFHWMQRNHWNCKNDGMLEMAKTLEDAGVVSVLLPYGPGGEDFSLHLPDVFRSTKSIKMMLAVGAYAVSPEYIAKTFFTMQEYGPDRLSLNLVAGRYSDHFEKMAIDNYHMDSSLMNTHEKRVAITEKWMKHFVNLIKDEPYNARLAVVGSSDTTIRVANKYTDYMFINGNLLGERDKITTTPILVIDPLILNPGENEENIEYNDYEFTKKDFHPFKGTHDEVKEMFLNISNEYNINDFLIHTDQKDISKLLRLVKDMSNMQP